MPLEIFWLRAVACVAVAGQERPLVVIQAVVPSNLYSSQADSSFPGWDRAIFLMEKAPKRRKSLRLNHHTALCFYTHRNSDKPVQVEQFFTRSPGLATRVQEQLIYLTR